jgi:hypothetical protein
LELRGVAFEVVFEVPFIEKFRQIRKRLSKKRVGLNLPEDEGFLVLEDFWVLDDFLMLNEVLELDFVDFEVALKRISGSVVEGFF